MDTGPLLDGWPPGPKPHASDLDRAPAPRTSPRRIPPRSLVRTLEHTLHDVVHRGRVDAASTRGLLAELAVATCEPEQLVVLDQMRRTLHAAERGSRDQLSQLAKYGWSYLALVDQRQPPATLAPFLA